MLFTAMGFLVFVGISLVVLRIFYGERTDHAVFVPPTPFAKPRLQTNDAADLARLQAEQRGRLAGYAWVDREKGIAAIPIEEAMKRVVARGADAYAPIDSNTSAQQPAGAGGGQSP
ncbi:hypothetical protein V4R08_18020 (plasmid) [Nitrobacter sp. NHB1]|uniref:hypothetical protein n=1 Tax=Nitrobacter sp. NHB1 TaxID=3119830 RepID=UPI003000F287